MGKNNKKRKNREAAAAAMSKEQNTREAAEAIKKIKVEEPLTVKMYACKSQSEAVKVKKEKSPTASSACKEKNPLFEEQRAFLQSLAATERDAFFSEEHVSPTRRAELWMEQADLGERLVNEHSWATPDDRAIRILKHFSPLVEIGCGANAYWCRQMKAAGVDVVGYDVAPGKGGKITAADEKKKTVQSEFRVKTGGPEVLEEINSNRTLFLCYPDENDDIDDETGEPVSMAAACLEHYQGDYVIHAGELITAANLSLDQAPWGRSSSPEFQERLLSEYHCLLSVSLPNWLHTSDTLTVWKRSGQVTIVFAAEDGDGDDESDEEVVYRYIPVEERLLVDIAAPCLQQLLSTKPPPTPDRGVASSAPGHDESRHGANATIENEEKPATASSKKTTTKRHQKTSNETLEAPKDANEESYKCPW